MQYDTSDTTRSVVIPSSDAPDPASLGIPQRSFWMNTVSTSRLGQYSKLDSNLGRAHGMSLEAVLVSRTYAMGIIQYEFPALGYVEASGKLRIYSLIQKFICGDAGTRSNATETFCAESACALMASSRRAP